MAGPGIALCVTLFFWTFIPPTVHGLFFDVVELRPNESPDDQRALRRLYRRSHFNAKLIQVCVCVCGVSSGREAVRPCT